MTAEYKMQGGGKREAEWSGKGRRIEPENRDGGGGQAAEESRPDLAGSAAWPAAGAGESSEANQRN